MKCAVIFGGSGFIGAFFAQHLLESKKYKKIYLYDIEKVSEKNFPYRQKLLQEYRSQIIEILGDVRKTITWVPEESVELIANFAAVHREPGHEDHEYYQTNLLGAQNVCSWATQIGCQEIVFTSSISPYGPSEDERTESSLTVPVTAYGGSKLVAEKIHQMWLVQDSARKLVIARPGVVFGPGEGGNVSRLIKAVTHKYFFYMGNRNTRKAGTYVKELCNAITWVQNLQTQENRNFSLFNMSMNPGPSIQEYVRTVCDVGGFSRTIINIPYPVLLALAYVIDTLTRPLGIKHPFSPVRIRKLVRSNNILPRFLTKNGYQYKYSLKTAFEDWKRDCPEEWN